MSSKSQVLYKHIPSYAMVMHMWTSKDNLWDPGISVCGALSPSWCSSNLSKVSRASLSHGFSWLWDWDVFDSGAQT